MTAGIGSGHLDLVDLMARFLQVRLGKLSLGLASFEPQDFPLQVVEVFASPSEFVGGVFK